MMKLESVQDSGKTVVLIHGRDDATCLALATSFRALASTRGSELPLHEVPGVHAVGGYRVVAINGLERRGIWVESEPGLYQWSQDSEGWLQAAELVEPFANLGVSQGVHFQFLEEVGSARLILSTERSW